MSETDRTPQLETILDRCLDAVLSGERTVDDCLADYPDFADDLRPVLQIALLTSHLKKPEMPAASVDALEMRLRGEMLRRSAQRSRWANFTPLGKLAAMVAIVFVCTLGVGGGAVAASANSLPGDPLYGVKRLWETIILALSGLFDETDDIWLHLAETRLDEAEDLAEHGLYYRDVLIDLYHATAESITLADSDTGPRMIAFLGEAQTRLRNLPTTASTEPLRSDLLLLVVDGSQQGSLRSPDSLTPPSLNDTGTAAPLAVLTDTATPTLRPSVTATATLTGTPTRTPTDTPTATITPSLTPTSRVPATATHTPVPPSPTRTPTPTITPSQTPTSTWTPLPLPFMPTSQPVGPTREPAGIRPSATPRSPTADATIRYRDTQAAVYATQTAQADTATEEAQP